MFSFVQAGQYYHAMQACYLCHNPNDLVDTSVPIEGEGVLAICKSCVTQMIDVAGIDTDSDVELETLATLNQRLVEEARDQKAQIRRLRSQLREQKSSG